MHTLRGIPPLRMLAAAALALALATAGRALAADPVAAPPTRAEYEGTLYLEAHFRHPGDVHAYHSREVYSTNGHGDARLDWTTWEDGDSLLVPETLLLVGGRVYHRDAPDKPWSRLAGERERQGRLHACAGLPIVFARARDRTPDDGELRETDGRPTGYTRLQTHPRLGDVRDSVAFAYAAGEDVPVTLGIALYQRDENWRLLEHRIAWSASALADSLFTPPGAQVPAPASEEDDTLAAMPPLTPVAPGVWSADLADIDSRTLIVEFSDYLAVIETAVGSANGERIVDSIRRRWPGKPIRYALFSHYHPHYTGGLRALIAEGATVVTTPGNAALVRTIAAYPFRTHQDRLARHPQPVKVETFADRYELEDAANRLVAIDYGERSQHTDEFVVFWLPRQKLLFETELGWVRVNGGVRASRRAPALLAWLAEQGLDVERVVQSYPMRDTPALLTRAELDSLVRLRR